MSSTKKKRPKPKTEDSSRFFGDSIIVPSKHEILQLFAVVAIAASVACTLNFAVVFFNRHPNPFCDSGELSQDPDSDLCEPCPENGHCSNGELECLHGYKKHGRKCIEDGEINQTANELSEWIENHVCTAFAQSLCDEAGKIWFQEADVRKLLDEHESGDNVGLKGDIFQFAKQKVMERLEDSMEKRANLNGSKEYKCPGMRAQLHKPLRCRAKQWIYQHVLLLSAFSVFLLGFIRLLWSLRQKQKLSTRAEQVYEQVCEILEDNALMAKSSNSDANPWVVASWLRDHLLLLKERKDPRLWKKVEELLLQDSRIDQYPKMVKGESKVVLEWQVQGSLSSKMKAKRTISKTNPGSQPIISSGYKQGVVATISETLNS